MKYEGGFQGRSNKLVDGCYSFWHGGMFPRVQPILLQQGQKWVGWGVANDLFTSGDSVMQDQQHWLFDRGQYEPNL